MGQMGQSYGIPCVPLSGFHTGFFAWGGKVFSHASMKHENVGRSGKILYLASLRLILVQF